MNPFTKPLNSADKVSRSYSVFTPDTSKFHGKYVDLAESNPYANVNYRKSWGQALLGMLGFRTNYDNYLEGMNLQAQEYENNLLLKQHDEDYNSPLEQVKREQAAGLNPDLTGNIDAGEAAPMRDDGNPPVMPESDFDQIIGFASSVVQGVHMAFSLASGVASLSSQILDNRSKRLNQIGQEDALAFNALMNVLPPESDEPLNYNQLYSKFKRAYGGSFKKRYFPSFVQRALQFQDSLAFSDKEYAAKNNMASNRVGYFGKASSPSYSAEDRVMREVSKVLSKLAYDTSIMNEEVSQKRLAAEDVRLGNDIKYQQDVRPQQMSNELEYLQGVDPSQLAANEMANSNLDVGLKRNAKDESDYYKLLRSSYKSLLKKLDALEEKGNWFAPYAKLAISALIMGNLPSTPITVNTGSRTNIFQQ